MAIVIVVITLGFGERVVPLAMLGLDLIELALVFSLDVSCTSRVFVLPRYRFRL